MQCSFHLRTQNILLWCFILKSSTFQIHYFATARKEVTESWQNIQTFGLEASQGVQFPIMICPSTLCGVACQTGVFWDKHTCARRVALQKAHSRMDFFTPSDSSRYRYNMSPHCLLACLLLLPAASQAARQVPPILVRMWLGDHSLFHEMLFRLFWNGVLWGSMSFR